MERQGHGFSFEQKVEALFGVNRANRGYTDKWDGTLYGFPVSIKVAKLGTDIEMADEKAEWKTTPLCFSFLLFGIRFLQSVIRKLILAVVGKHTL